MIRTDAQTVCDIFANLFSTIAIHIDRNDHIDLSQENYFSRQACQS